jgi:glycosyltransferase involved in cell wall biosynthesis
VFSNLPPPRYSTVDEHRKEVIGLFGYSYDGAAVSLMLDALRLVKDRLPDVELILLGAPGPASPAADVWQRAAEKRDVAGAISFSGRLSAQGLSDALAACDVLLSADPSGPTSRKTTLAASLASGRAVVALDGPRTWPELSRSDAALVVRPTPGALADAIAGLLRDADTREALGARGAAFAGRAMGVAASARAVAGLLGQVVTGVE